MMGKLKTSIRRVALPVVVIGGVLFWLTAVGRAAIAQDFEPAFEPAPCMFEGIDLGLTTIGGEALGFECGYVTVPVRHEEPNGPTLRLPVAIRRATSESPRPDPLFLAQGGPGGDAFGIFPLLVPPTSIAANRDLVVFNQRGAQYTEPDLTCPEIYDALAETLAADAEEGDRIYQEALASCHERLAAAGIDISAFNSLQNAADVEAIRRALGYDEYNFYGVSYGTLLGLHLMANNPEGLRSVILDSVAPTDINFVTELPNSEDRVYDALLAACAADATCRDEYPNLEARYLAVLDQLDAEPVTLKLKEADTGQTYDMYLDGAALQDVVYQLLYLRHMYAAFPKLVQEFEEGDFRYIEAMAPLFVFDRSNSEGMYYSVICAEDADFDPADVDLSDVRPEIAEGAREELQSYLDSCAIWPVDQLPSTIDEPVVSDIPTLLLSGEFDPITPPYFAAAAAAGLSNATNLVDPTASHGVAFQSECVNGIVEAFLDDPATTPDSSCLAAEPLDATVPANAILLPLLAKVNSLDSGTVVQASLGAFLLALVLSAFAIWPLAWFIRMVRNQRRTFDAPRLRWASRILVLVFGVLTAIFVIGLSGFIAGALVKAAYATAMALPASAAPILWLPLILLLLAIGIVISAFMLWLRPGSSSTGGKIYYAFLALAVVGIIVLLGMQGLLLPPL